MEAGIIWMIIIVGLIMVLLPLLFRYVIPGMYAIMVSLTWALFFVMDHLFSAALFRAHPWIMWAVWGAIIGAALAFWTLAPIYGLRRQRKLIALAPFALMGLVALLRVAVLGVK